jgi:hypothetical protein
VPDSRHMRKQAESWWQTLPGLVTAVAALITAVVGAIVGLYQAGIFKGDVNQRPSNENMRVAGMAHQGKEGDEQSTAQWIFQVRSVSKTDEYVERYYQPQNIVRPQGGNDVLVIIDARLKNRLQQTMSPVLTERVPGNTGLVDDAGHSYQPVDYDARQAEGSKISSFEGAPLLPGAAADFALVFSVPRGTKPKLLIFTLKDYGHFSEGTDVQVSLNK